MGHDGGRGLPADRDLPCAHAAYAGSGGGRGIPHLSHGLYPTIDDVAKLTTLLQHGGRHQGQQLLSAAKLAEALYKTNAMGLPSRLENRFGEGRYHLSFWSLPYRTANGCFFQIPFMAGHGGNVVMLLPNGISTFRFTDGGNAADLDTMVLAGEAIRPFPCPSGPPEAPPGEHQPLSASELRAELVGNTLYWNPVNIFPGIPGGQLNIFLAADGALYGTLKAEPDLGTWHAVGRWHITPDGQFCRRWHTWGKGCYTVYREGETFEFSRKDRFVKEVYRCMLGNPEGY